MFVILSWIKESSVLFQTVPSPKYGSFTMYGLYFHLSFCTKISCYFKKSFHNFAITLYIYTL